MMAKKQEEQPQTTFKASSNDSSTQNIQEEYNKIKSQEELQNSKCKDKSCETCAEKENCEFANLNVEQKIEDAKKSVEKSRTSKSKLWSFIFLLINIIVFAVIIIYQINTEEGLSFGLLFELVGDKWWCLALALASFALYMSVEAFRYWLLLRATTKHNRPFLSYKVAAVGLYYDNITPLAVGGQPFQIFYLSNRGIKPSVASGIPFAKTIFAQLAFAITGICVLIFSKIIAGGLDRVTYYAAVFGIAIQLVLVGTILLLSTSKKIGPTIVRGIFNFLAKIKIIKDKEKSFAKVMNFVAEYQASMRALMANVVTFILTGVVSFLSICVKALIPFFIVCAFSGFNLDLYGTIFIITILIDAIMSYIPWPGASGVAEVSFSLLFSHSLIGLTGAGLVWAMLLWRILTYYSLLLQGVGVMVYDYLIGNKKIPRTIARLRKIERRRELRQIYLKMKKDIDLE